ncbi:cell division protein FtsZ [Comamonas sp. Y33R10-2]|uniref:cell division protein FtsZ n=1 Tax=Comamonas sp. Y33R10-2 TaxID=2853257 RepID=UPI001C5C98CE|nr:cell division protein FtsZ [Comamonas sp. Y33R10-2]QXZ10820.1 cell division protein FtsZ [Comamonas sp. Y33R10-2]
MSHLQISLAVLGVVLLILIIAYNSWSARRNAPKRAEPVEESADPLRHEPGMNTVGHGSDLTKYQSEPVLGDFGQAIPGAEPVQLPEAAGRFAEADAELARLVARDAHEDAQRQESAAQDNLAAQNGAQPEGEVTAQRTDAAIAAVNGQAASTKEHTQPIEPVLTGELLSASIPPASSVERRGYLDALIDAIAPITVAQPVPGEVALQAQPSTRRAGNKPFSIEGMNKDSKEWEPLQAGQRYLGFQAGVQLANRTGSLNEIEFSEFVTKIQRFADALGAMADVPNMLNEVARARELDQFASEHDAQLSFMLRARQASWSAGYVQQNAQRLGFVTTPMPGRMVLQSPHHGLPPELVLSYDPQAAMGADLDQSVVREFLLSLDVAQVPRGQQPFVRLRQVAEQLCQTMDGVLCDQNGYLLPVSALDPIQHDLELLYDKLDSRELSAGSLLARRLFS